MQATVVVASGHFRSGRIVDHLGQGFLVLQCEEGRVIGRNIDHPAVKRALEARRS